MCNADPDEVIQVSESYPKSTPMFVGMTIEQHSVETFKGYLKHNGEIFIIDNKKTIEAMIKDGKKEETVTNEVDEECHLPIEEFLSYDWRVFYFDPIVAATDLLDDNAIQAFTDLYWATKAERATKEKRWLHDDGAPITEKEVIHFLRT
jgi:hypothetical protein